MIIGAVVLAAACGPKPSAQVEKVEICTEVGDYDLVNNTSGASSGGGCTMRFMMQFADRVKAAIPCCAMDPIVPIHKVDEKYPGQFTDDVEKVWTSDKACKVASTYAYSEARKRLGATSDKVLIYSDEDLISWGVAPMMAHFSWVPLLDDYSEGSPMSWMIAQF